MDTSMFDMVIIQNSTIYQLQYYDYRAIPYFSITVLRRFFSSSSASRLAYLDRGIIKFESH